MLKMHLYLPNKNVSLSPVDMSDPPGHFMLFCKLQKGGLADAKRSQRDI
jgi:hypothetical protein